MFMAFPLCSDEDIVDATLKELERLFPTEVRADGSMAKVRKSIVVKTPRSVYKAVTGRQAFRPGQTHAHLQLLPGRGLHHAGAHCSLLLFLLLWHFFSAWAS